MSVDTLSIPTWQKGCIEETVVLNESKNVYKYTFSDSLENIKIAIYARTGHKINLEKALWKKNPGLSISVKHLMNTHNVNYSMTTDTRDKERFITVNMRVGDNWYVTGYDEINGRFVSWENLRILSMFVDFLEMNNSSYDDDEDDE